MSVEQARVTTVAYLEGFLEARLWQWDGLDDIFEVHVSPLMRTTSRFLKPVYGLLEDNCTRETEWKDEKVVGMFGNGHGQLTMYSVYKICPGGSIPHDCKFERSEAFANIEGE